MNCVVGLLLSCSLCRPAGGDDDFPYKAYVKSRRPAKVYSGPGIDFYTTDQLDRGSEIEVYKHLDNQWAAIRPPAGSFSLVPVTRTACIRQQ